MVVLNRKNMHFTRIFVGALLTLNFSAHAQLSSDTFYFPEPDKREKILSLWATHYYIHEFQSSGKIPIVYASGEKSGLYADTCDFCKAALEGTAYVKDSSGNVSVINFSRTGNELFVDCRKCKQFASVKLNVESWGKTIWSKSAGYGDGVKNYRLVPFRTIAVDPNTIPYGTVIFVPAAKGKLVHLPNGKQAIHDGYFFAGDTGGAITKNHIDVFTGIYPGNPFPEVVRSNENKVFDAFIVSDPEIVRTLTVLHSK